jgi:hypothetical protein
MSYQENDDETQVVATPHALVITLGNEHKEQARACLEKSGEVKFSLKEISVSELPQTRGGANHIIID